MKDGNKRNKVRIKFCGMRSLQDIETANNIGCDYVGFVFAKKSKRYINEETAAELKKALNPEIKAVGVFVDEEPQIVARLLNTGVIDIAQLHGREEEDDIGELRKLTGNKPVIKAFRITSKEDVKAANKSTADLVLVDAGAGEGKTFDWSLLSEMKRPYLLAGGLSPENVGDAIQRIHPYGVDVSSGIETGGVKDPEKMRAFAENVRAFQE
ncbi:MAG: phosphoribosylanthranilate isomerase [Lachnospiraceae bacterium]|nr:phosphoribosylanthranilate isomerase [Lachnospiraceae bacterium]